MIDIETPSMNHLTHPFITQHFATGGPHTDVHPGAMGGPEIDHQSGGDMWNTFTTGIDAESPGEAASETSVSDVPIDESMGTIAMRTTIGRDKQLVSAFLFLRRLVLL